MRKKQAYATQPSSGRRLTIFLLLLVATFALSVLALPYTNKVSGFVYAVFFIGFGEEILFRGYVQGRLNEAFGLPYKFLGVSCGAGLIITALLFAMMHALAGGVPLDLWWGLWTFFGSDNLGQVLLDPRNILIFAGYLIVTGVLSLFMDSIIRQSQERRRLIEELEATREELATEERRAGMLEERGRLAREIHDTLAQGFISIVTHLEAAEEALATGDEAVRMHLDQARRTARESLSEARRVVRALRPELLEGSSLPEALERLAGRWSEETGVRAEVEVSGDPRPLSQELQVTLFRAAQEALTNARKHARAAGVTLTLSYIGDLVVLDVQDDGEGFDPDLASAASEGGLGLRSMRERVERLGGRLLVESSPGEGTTLVIELPVGVEEEPAIADAEKTS